jgi:phage FluMu protein Com
MAIIYEDDYGVLLCECGKIILCNKFGDFPLKCPKCKGVLDWSEWDKTNLA